MPDLDLDMGLGHDPAAAGAHLTGRAACVARQLADVLRQNCSPQSGASEAVTFLVDWADAHAPHNGAPPAQHPIEARLDGPVDAQTDVQASSPVERLVQRFGLTPEEVDLMVLTGLAEEHEGLAATFRALHPQGAAHPSLGLAALLWGGTVADRDRLRRLVHAGAATRHAILEVASEGPFFERSLGLAQGLWEVLRGYDGWPRGLPRVPVPAVPPGLDGWLRDPPTRRAAQAVKADDRLCVVLACADETVTLGRCAALAEQSGRALLPVRMDVGEPGQLALLAVHAAARDAVPVLLVGPAAADRSAPRLDLTAFPGTVLVCAPPGEAGTPVDRPLLTLVADAVEPDDVLVAWRAGLPGMNGRAEALAIRHPLDPALVAQVAVDAAARDHVLDLADIASLVRSRAALRLPAGVTLQTPTVDWEELVLEPDAAAQLKEAVARLDHQTLVLDEWGLRGTARASRGARLLFSGPPGTGKSLAARALAAAAETDLLVVDISSIVSKWLGETEKNLAAAFAVAEQTQAVLLLDEADSLFASRTEVSDSHDRYANLETSYLLQRLDSFEGLVVLTTNLSANIDTAFLRRMDFVVEFPLPGAKDRARLWALLLPPGHEVDPTFVDDLAQLYAVPGAWIRNAMVAAAFRAASDGGRIGPDHLVHAMRREYAKAALPFPGEPTRRRHDIQ